jgi:hypothetical protein
MCRQETNPKAGPRRSRRSAGEGVGKQQHQGDNQAVDREGLHEGQRDQQGAADFAFGFGLTGNAFDSAASRVALTDAGADGADTDSQTSSHDGGGGSKRIHGEKGMRGAWAARNEPVWETCAWDIPRDGPGSSRTCAQRVCQTGDTRQTIGSVVLFVHRLSDVVGGQSGEDQGLDRAGEQTQEHRRQRHDQGHKESQHRHDQLVGKNVAKKTERE